MERTPVGFPKPSCMVSCQQAHHTGHPRLCFEDVGKRDMNQTAVDPNSWEDIAKELLETDCCYRNRSGWWEALLSCAREETAEKNTSSNSHSCASPPPLQKHCHSRVWLFSYSCCCNRNWWAFKHIVCTDWCLLLLLRRKGFLVKNGGKKENTFAHKIPEHLLDEFISIKFMPSFSTEDES